MSSQILVIAEQQRLQRLFDGMAEAQARGVTVVAGLAGAADQLARELPGLILVQDRLSGLSGELIVRHLRSRLGDAATMLVLATEAVDTLETVMDGLHLVDTSLPDQDLVRQLERLVTRLPAAQQELPLTPEAEPAIPEEFVPLMVPNLVISGAEPVTAAESAAPAGDFASAIAEPPPAIVVAELGDEVVTAEVAPVVSSRFEAELETELARLEPTTVTLSAASNAAPVMSVDDMLTAAVLPPPRANSRGGRLLVVFAVLLVLVGSTWFWYRSEPQQPATVAKMPPPAAVKAVPPTLPVPAPVVPPVSPLLAPAAVSLPPPRFVSSAQAVPDPSYGRDHPGWERYLSATLDFKLYREQGKLQAVQVVDRAGEGISPRLFTAAMEELTRVRDYRTEGREVKGDYLVKKGRLSSGGKILIYKDRQDTVLHGFVIYFN